MRLLKINSDGSLSLTWFRHDNTPRYAILSHTWEADDQELTFQDMVHGAGTDKTGYRKILFCRDQARNADLQYFWVDSCCIDKTSSAELSEAINSMFRWYQNAVQCYVYLSDISIKNFGRQALPAQLLDDSTLRTSKWFSRGWTLQELLAPRSVGFFCHEGQFLGDKASLELQICNITGIPAKALQGTSLSYFGIDERMAWAARRQTTIAEDQAYCLLGIFDIHLPSIYGEGLSNAFIRLQDEIKRRTERSSKTFKELAKLLKEFIKTDPSPNHNGACTLHEDHTGKWLLRSPEYTDWLSGQTKFLWVHGIPGAGKTVQASFIFQQVHHFCQESSPSAFGNAYYYCYFGRNQDETSPFLRWIISQLCRQLKDIPSPLISLLRRGTEPGYEDILGLLATVLESFQRVYVIIDALDESQNRENMIDLLRRFTMDPPFDKMRIFTTSRLERDIELGLVGLGPSISMSNQYVDQDISLFIESRLQTDRKLKSWQPILKAEITQALIKGAHGMFRWVACQLEILSRVYTVPQIRKALSELPKTIEETYERILTNIIPSSRTMAHKVLQLVAYSEMNNINQIAEAVIVDIEACKFSREDRLIDPIHLLDICLCLISIEDDGTMILAHYTVAEYLESPRILSGPAAMFHMDNTSARHLETKTFITYLINLPFQEFTSAEVFFSLSRDIQNDYIDRREGEFPLITWAVLDWSTDMSRRTFRPDASIKELTLRLLRPSSSNFQLLRALSLMWNRGSGARYFYFKFYERSQFSMELSYLCWFDLIDAAEELLQQKWDPLRLEHRLEPCNNFLDHYNAHEDAEGTPLQIAAMLRRLEFVNLFIEYGAHVNARHGPWTVLTLALRNKKDRTNRYFGGPSFLSIVDALLHSGADANPTAVCKTPLQLAVEGSHDIDVIKSLLDAGADVNAVGDPQAVAYDMRTRSQAASTRRDSECIESYCSTPLRLAEDKLNDLRVTQFSKEREESILHFSTVHRILQERGAISEAFATNTDGIAS